MSSAEGKQNISFCKRARAPYGFSSSAPQCPHDGRPKCTIFAWMADSAAPVSGCSLCHVQCTKVCPGPCSGWMQPGDKMRRGGLSLPCCLNSSFNCIWLLRCTLLLKTGIREFGCSNRSCRSLLTVSSRDSSWFQSSLVTAIENIN